MFDDVKHIEKMTPHEHKQVVYDLNHPDEYEGDFITFRDKVVEFATKQKTGDFIYIITEKSKSKGAVLCSSFVDVLNMITLPQGRRRRPSSRYR